MLKPVRTPRPSLGHLGCVSMGRQAAIGWGVYLWAGQPPLADIILSHPPDLT